MNDINKSHGNLEALTIGIDEIFKGRLGFDQRYRKVGTVKIQKTWRSVVAEVLVLGHWSMQYAISPNTNDDFFPYDLRCLSRQVHRQRPDHSVD